MMGKHSISSEHLQRVGNYMSLPKFGSWDLKERAVMHFPGLYEEMNQYLTV